MSGISLEDFMSDNSTAGKLKKLPEANIAKTANEPTGLLGGGFTGELLQTGGSLLGMAKKATVPGMALSALGGAGGEAFKQLGQHATSSPLAPTSSMDAAKRIGGAAAEEFIFEGGGRAVGAGFGKLGAKFKPELKEGFEEFETNFERFGGKLSATQRIEHKNLASWAMLTADGLSRGSITAKGIFKNFDEMNEHALRKMADSLVDDIAEKATSELSDHQVGRMFIEAMDTGKATHNAASTINYKAVDNIAKANNVTVLPDSIKGVARKWQKKFGNIGNVGKGDIASTEIERVLSINGPLSFEDAHFLRSSLLNKQRELALSGETGISKKIIGELIDATQSSMDEAGKIGGVNEAYKKASKFYKFGARAFNDKFIVDMMNKAPERMGETIFRAGNVSQVIKARQALKRASLIDKSINFDQTWRGIQEGYMAGVLSGPLVDAEGVAVGNRILKLFNDRKKLRTLKSAFSPTQLKSLKEFGKIASAVQEPPAAGLSMVMNLTQAGAVIGLMGGVIEEGAAPLFIAPPVIAKMLTNPKTSGAFIKAFTTPLTSTKSTALVTKLIGDINTADREVSKKAAEKKLQGMEGQALSVEDFMGINEEQQ